MKIRNSLLQMLVLLLLPAYSTSLLNLIESNPNSAHFGTITIDGNRYMSWENHTFSGALLFESPDSVVCQFSRVDGTDITACVTYIRKGEEIEWSLKQWSPSKQEYKKSFSLKNETKADRVVSRGISGKDKIYNFSRDNEKINSEHLLTVEGNNFKHKFFVNNPFHSNWTLQQSGCFDFDIMRTLPSFDVGGDDGWPKAPDAYSTISANDTIFRKIIISCEGTISTPLGFSELPFACPQALTMYWDELPDLSLKFMTTADNKDAVDHIWLQLLDAHPRIRMGYVMLLDRIIRSIPESRVKNWNITEVGTVMDSLDEYRGTWCISMINQRKRSATLSQSVRLKPGQNTTISYMLKTEDIVGEGAVVRVYNAFDSSLLTESTPVLEQASWKQMTHSFSTGNADSVIVSFEHDGTGVVFVDEVVLSQGGSTTNYIQNGGFEHGDPTIVYDNKRRHYSDAHSWWHLASKATPEYIEFLQSVENSTLRYGWEDRVSLGLHGYHHIPNMYRPDQSQPGIIKPGAEFQHYDPFGDSLRLARIKQDMDSIGLTGRSRTYFRAAGTMYTKSLVDQLLNYEYTFLDISFRHETDLIMPIIRDNKMLWNVSLCFWFDEKTEFSSRVYELLDRGRFAHMGGHPFATTYLYDQSISRFDILDAMFTNIESRYPNMGYLLPDEYSENATSVYRAELEVISSDASQIVAVVRGVDDSGVTVVFGGEGKDFLFNGEKLNPTVEGGGTYLELPRSSLAVDTLKIISPKVSTTKPTIKPIGKHSAFISNGKLVLDLFKGDVELEVFNLQGRILLKRPVTITSDRTEISISSLDLAKGIYIVKISTDKFSPTTLIFAR